jgi:hypothetical protein
LTQVRKVTPMSSLAVAEYDRLTPQGASKRTNTVDSSLKVLQTKPMRTHKFKPTILPCLKALAAEANEALEVAVEIGNLVRFRSLSILPC